MDMEFNTRAVQRMLLDMYANGLATKNTLTLMNDPEFLKEFYEMIKNCNEEHVIDRYKFYCESISVTNDN